MKGADKPSEVQLTIQHPISQLVLMEPLQPSQKITRHQSGQIKLCITVFENEEFYATILSLGAHCTVNKPASLRKKIKEMVAAMALNYPS
jgi:predicted DNA-binding transcriptional regulator YafY